uniref:PDZ domain-containing protein n=1 Tax=Wuchereria bancrofti TaxID=6293 RepID=A0AAF5PT55_WUCBA
MPFYPTLEDLLVDQYQYQKYGSCSDHSSQPFHSCKEPSAPLFESNSPIPGRIYETVDENIMSAAPKEMLEYPLLPSYQESITQTQHASVLKSSAQLPKITTARVPYPHLPQSVAVQQYMSNSLTLLENDCIVATITSQCSGLIKANLTHGVRKVILNRTKGKKYGLRMRAVNQGVFVQLVADGSPAAAAGIRFGDQLLNLNGTEVLGMSGQKVMDIMRKSKHEVVLMFKDRPLARTITLHKDATGLLGFAFKDNLITAVMQESSASRNGLLINQRIIEVDGQNVMAFKNKAMKSCLDDAPMTVTLTLMPAEFYDEITKNLDRSLMKKQNHTVPQL